MNHIIINKYPYRVYESERQLRMQIKRVKEKIKARTGYYKDQPNRYRDYPELLVYLEQLYRDKYLLN